MPEDSLREQALEAMRRINREWLAGQVTSLAPLLHPNIVMAFQGSTNDVRGREALLAGFRDFVENAKVSEYRESDHQVNIEGKNVVVSYHFEMVYERDGERYRSTGRDVWVFQEEGGDLVATWRSMLDVEEKQE